MPTRNYTAINFREIRNQLETSLSFLCVLRKRVDDHAFPPLPVISGV